MRIPSLLTFLALLGTSTWAQHKDSHNYVQLSLGAVNSETAKGAPSDNSPTNEDDFSFDIGYSAGLALGRNYRLTERWSIDAEIEAFYQAFTVDETDLTRAFGNDPAREDNAKTFSFMLNGLVEWEFTPQFALYGGLGVGWAKEIEYAAWDVGGFDNDNTDGLAFQARLGGVYNLGGTNDFLVGYRYFKTEPVDISNAAGAGGEIDVAQHSLEALFRWGL